MWESKLFVILAFKEHINVSGKHDAAIEELKKRINDRKSDILELKSNSQKRVSTSAISEDELKKKKKVIRDVDKEYILRCK